MRQTRDDVGAREKERTIRGPISNAVADAARESVTAT